MPVSSPIEHIRHTLDQDSSLQLQTHAFETKDVVVEWLGTGKCQVQVTLAPESSLRLFYLNQGQALELEETYQLKRNASLDLSYADFNDAPLNRSSNVLLEEEGASVKLKSAILVQSHKELNYRFSHQARHTIGEMENFAVSLNEGSMNLHAIGHIQKDAAQSETHQSSRILNYNSIQRAAVFPQLIIDNNDVKASHAQSSGQIDPEHLYYLQSRGLSFKDAIRLIIQGYLSSILEAIHDEDLRTSLQATIEEKVDHVCSI